MFCSHAKRGNEDEAYIEDKMNNNFRLNACVGTNGGAPSFNRMATGFFEASLILIDQVIETERRMDIIIYPALELYRHGFELMSKSIAESVEFIINKNEILKTDHNIHELWDKIYPELEKIGPIPDDLRIPIDETMAYLKKWL